MTTKTEMTETKKQEPKTEKRFGSIVESPVDKRGRTIFVNTNPKCDGLNYHEVAIKSWANEIMDDLRPVIRKPFLRFFGGTKEIVLNGPEPLWQIELVLRVIRTLRQEGFRGTITIETMGDVNRFNKLWINGSNCYTYQNGQLLDVQTTHQQHSDGIAQYLKRAGLSRITVKIDKTGRFEDYESSEAYGLVRECLRAKLGTYVQLVVRPEKIATYLKKEELEWLSDWDWMHGKSYKLQASHLSIIEGT